MVRETRHLWVGNLPDNIREDRIREHFKRYGRVQSVKLLPRCTEEKTGEITMACTVAFMDIKSASKAHNAELKIDDRTLNTEYYEPAAIPSAALPQNNTPSPYSTSPGTTRFPNGHGSSDEHGTFPERFYERSTPRLAAGGEGEFIRRGSSSAAAATVAGSTAAGTAGYHDCSSRSRNRDRAYRNGPTSSTAASVERHSRTGGSAVGWTYDSNRYNNSTGNSQTDTGYSATPLENNERRNSDQSSKKKTKSRSGSRSPSPSGSTSSRSPSRSRSRSSSSSSSSSTSRDTSSTSSPKSRRLASATNSNHQPVVHSDDRRPLAICVKNLPVRSSDTSLKDGLFHEYKKHGKVTWVKVVGKDSERHAIVCFKKPEDVEKAIEVSYDKLFFGCKIEVAPYQGYDVEDNDLRPYEAEIDEFHPKATRTLFIGNLEKDVTALDLRKHFDQFGEIIEIDIKKQGAVSSYAFCQYSDIVSVVKAIRKMDGEHLGNNRIKLGFGKSMQYNCVWVDGVSESVNEKYLKMHFDPFGVINKVHIDREKGQALIFYEQVLNAQAAVNKMRGFSLKNTKIQVDFASRECQESFFEKIEKQGAVLDRSIFEDRRDPTTRTFETSTVSRFSRYDTPTRPRTSSYSSRSSVAASQVTSSLQSPGTPGSVTPRGSSSRSRSARFTEYYDQTLDYPERHFRNYDEYSQGSAASHEDIYEHDYPFIHDSPTHLDPMQGIVDTVVPFAPPDMRNLQKERVHLLEQLEECPSSGDELMSPKKRLKLDLLDSAMTSDVIIEANRDHRKVMEVRRLSDVSLKHHSRRPSVDSGKHIRHEIGYLPHAVCKRRKTAGSDSGSKVQHYDHSGSDSVGGSRPGTPLCDERPENFQPSEPRRVPREREGPLTLPLPRFAAQMINRGSVSVAGIKGQKDNVLSSPPPAVTSPRITNPRPPSPVHVPPPASPPPRPPSLSSNSSDSDVTPPSPSLDERIKSLDEKYEKWSGTRALSTAGGDALALLDASLEKFRQRHKILDLDLKEVQPSEIVKSVMAKRSVFDEDLKRLENVGEKYEPKEFSLFPRSIITTQNSTPTTPLPALKVTPVTQLPKTPTMLSPRSAGSNIPAAKGLQYPFPTHPPLLMSPVTSHPLTPPMPTTSAPVLMTTAATSTTTVSTTATASIRGTGHGENRLKPCSSVPSDTRTSSKMNLNKSTVVSSLKVCEKTNVNIPNANDAGSTSEKHKHAREVKSSEKTSEKITSRRDSNSNSPRADVKTRRNSDTSARRIDESEAVGSHKERAQSEERKRDRFEKIKKKTKMEREKSEKERIERERLENEKQEKIRLEKERLEKERLERESELDKEKREREEKERREREQQERERMEKERKEREQKEREEAATAATKKEQEEKERRDLEEHERRMKEEQERKEQEHSRHKDDNHDKRRDDHKHRDSHGDSKHRENNIDKHILDNKITKDSTKEEKSSRDINQTSTKDSHDPKSGHDKNKLYLEKEVERRKDSIKENRDNNVHDKHKSNNESNIRGFTESRHMSIDLDKNKNSEKPDLMKRKERNNSLPANIGSKRRLSSHESIEVSDENKKVKLSHDHKKLSERRDSKDSSRSEERGKSSKHKNNINKSHEKHSTSKDCDEKRKEKEERHKKHKLEKQKSKSKSREKESNESPSTPKTLLDIADKEFLNRLDLQSIDEIDKQQKECKEKRKESISEEQDRNRKEKIPSLEKVHNSEKVLKGRTDMDIFSKTGEERKKRERIRKLTNSSDTDSDEPKKHSIFDIVDDEPAYISMYDKVKARSCKNMAKLEEEKRQEKLKAKFNQLKQSRAKREEKKRSTSWDEDSDSERDPSERK
ncbi:hypothetical protein JTB14_018116 [Gonioctena quinquepunctata]|nr:hypothetical protein JTB14_018116 [Gonioctena quinquepunctata]